MGDTDLLLALSQGSEGAFREIYDRYQPKLSRYLFPFVNDRPHLIDEIIQEVFIKVWTKREMLTGIDKIEYYLQRMARNQLMDLIRQQRIQQKHESKVTVSPITEKETEDFLQLKEYHQMAREAIAQLPERRRYLLSLSMVDGYSLDEIVEKTRLSKAVVKKQLFKANAFLRQYLKKNGDIVILAFILYELT